MATPAPTDPLRAGPAALPARWRKSSRSFPIDDCVEVAEFPHIVAVRDSKAAPDGPVLVLTTRQWTTFLRRIHNGDHNLPN